MPAYKFCPICGKKMASQRVASWDGGERIGYRCPNGDCNTSSTQDYGDKPMPNDPNQVRIGR